MSSIPAVTKVDSASIDFKMPAPGDQGYDQWRLTGKLPEFQEPPEEKKVEREPPQVQKQEAGSSEEEESATSASVTRAASEAARPQKKGAESRKAQLQQEIRDRANEVRELARQAEELRKALAEARKPESHTASEAEPEVKDKPKKQAKAEASPEPQLGDKNADGTAKYKDWAEYTAAVRKWDREQAKAEILAEFESRQTKQQTDQQKAQKEAEAARVKQAVAEGFRTKVDEARKKYADYDDVAFAKTPDGSQYLLDIPEGSAMDQFILSSPHGTDVLYHLGKNYDNVKNIFERNGNGLFKTNPIDQLRELFKIEQKLSAPKPANRVSQAPPPPHQVQGKAAGNVDEVEKAVTDGDQEAFTRLENERILAKRLQGRRRA